MTRLVLGLFVVSGVLAAGAYAAAPQNTAQPTIEGKLQVGETVTATRGTWTNSPTDFDYQWQRCNNAGESCANIPGERDNDYKLTDNDVGKTLRVIVTAKNSDGATEASSRPSAVVSGDQAPRMQARPTISGKPQVGETLTADPGEWTQGPTFTYQWQQCDKSGANCTEIQGATGKTYGVRAADRDHTIRVEVTAKNLEGSTTAVSDRTDVVTGTATPTPTPAPTPVGVGGAISITAISLPNRLVISQIQFTPRVIRSRNVPITARFKITEVNAGKPVSGALVYAIAVPATQVSRPGEVQTDSTGWATVRFMPTTRLPMKAGARVNFFVRARKSGENPLAGVSTRRLVSVGISPAR